MEFKKYQHIERFGTMEVEGIELGECFIFPKIDGTNGSVWFNDGIMAGSRNRIVSIENDNAGFCNFVIENENIKRYLEKHPTHRLYGEWLVPHSLRTYREDAWRRFYIFDVCIDKESDDIEYIPYEIYAPMLEEFGLDYIPAMAKIKNGSYENFLKSLENNVFLIRDGSGAGEGVVIKNYDFYNKYKRQTWAKIVTSEFKEKHFKVMGATELTASKMIEEVIIDKYCTQAFIEKEYQKIVNENDGWSTKFIPQLFGRLFSELIKEEMWHIVKELKQPTVNFKTLNTLIINKTKQVKREIF